VCVVGSEEWQSTSNETRLSYVNVTDVELEAVYEMVAVAVNDVGTTASDHILVLVGTPYAQFGSFTSC